ncbi:hypothetical protein LH47_02748 [Anoxybacillus thermarum]|uniref:Uncharacterized protein n=1 Tax=Anoxybacillus thermarum TaxID=404937 RepID=A0A0D0QUI6_9BACL|nr:hypothetical protein LH47_02748 [Anoxybacillus thermarum]
MTFAFFYRASLGGPDERREQKFATLVGESFLNVTHKYFTHTILPAHLRRAIRVRLLVLKEQLIDQIRGFLNAQVVATLH